MIDEISWQQWVNLPQMSKLPLHEVERHYRIYLNEVTEQRVALMMLQERVSQAEAMAVAASNGGGSYIERIVNNCIEFVANTSDSVYFDVLIGISAETTYTVDWGDGSTEEGTLTDVEGDNLLEHEYADSSEEYSVRLCFANPNVVTSLEFEGND